jgi:hypothetical protein
VTFQVNIVAGTIENEINCKKVSFIHPIFKAKFMSTHPTNQLTVVVIKFSSKVIHDFRSIELCGEEE